MVERGEQSMEKILPSLRSIRGLSAVGVALDAKAIVRMRQAWPLLSWSLQGIGRAKDWTNRNKYLSMHVVVL